MQPTRLLHPWDFPDRSTGVGCHCLLRHTKHIPIKGGRQMWQVVENTLNYVKDIRCSLKVLLLELSLKLKGFGSRDTRDMGLILGSGRSPRIGNGNLLQYSSLENFMDRGAWRNTVHWITKSQTQLSN